MGVAADFFYCEAWAGAPDLCVDLREDLLAVLCPAPEPVFAEPERLFWGDLPAG